MLSSTLSSSVARCNRSVSATPRPLAARPQRIVRCRNIYKEAGQDFMAASTADAVVITLKTPVGIVFGQKSPGQPVVVEEVTAGGAADKSGKVAVGDILTRCSAVILKEGKEGTYANEGYGQRTYDNWEKVMFDCKGQDFKTVMSALKSNTPRWGIMDVTLEFVKPKP